jgi:hypothetical protein
VPPEVPAGNAVPVVLSTGSRVSAAAGLRIAGVQPVPVSLELAEPDIRAAAPASWLQLNVKGLRPAAPTGVRFFDGGRFSRTVEAFEVTPDSLATVVPPFYDQAKRGFGPGTVAIEVFQLVNGRAVTSNRVQGFQIEDLPEINLPPGRLTSAAFRALSQSTTEMQGVLSFTESTSVRSPSDVYPKLGTTRTRGLMDDLKQKTSAVRAVIEDVSNSPGKSVRLGVLDGSPVTLDSAFLAATDRLLAASILAQPPGYSPAAPSPAAASASLFGGKQGQAASQAIRLPAIDLPDCEIPEPPAGKQLRDLITGRRPAISYAQDYQACLETLARLQSIADFSEGLNRRTKYWDRKIKLLLFGT